MEWIIAYLASVIVVANIIALVITGRRGDNDKVVIYRDMDILFANIHCLFWPIVLPYIGVTNFIQARKKHVTETAKSILGNYPFGNRDDQSFILNVPEWKLKYLLKAYRKKLVEIPTPHVEMIRQELMSRNMERNLLK